MPDLVSISLGAGVQSSCMYLMACAGEIKPRPDVAIFADTQCEPAWVYEHLDYLESLHGIEILRATAGNLGEDSLRSQDGERRFAAIPFFVESPGTAQLNWVTGEVDAKHGQLRRQCTREYKIDVVKRAIRQRLGLMPRQRAKGKVSVEEWVGISTDEATRAKPSRYDWISTRWPLLEKSMSRSDCKEWMSDHGYRIPLKSACVFCPFRDDATWAWMKREHPGEFKRAVDFERELQKRPLRGVRAVPFLHASLRSLDCVEFREGDHGDRFENDCEGMCGV